MFKQESERPVSWESVFLALVNSPCVTQKATDLIRPSVFPLAIPTPAPTVPTIAVPVVVSRKRRAEDEFSPLSDASSPVTPTPVIASAVSVPVPTEKLLKKRLSNQQAAQRSREKKRRHVEELETKLAALEQSNRELSAKVEALMQENSRLHKEKSTTSSAVPMTTVKTETVSLSTVCESAALTERHGVSLQPEIPWSDKPHLSPQQRMELALAPSRLPAPARALRFAFLILVMLLCRMAPHFLQQLQQQSSPRPQSQSVSRLRRSQQQHSTLQVGYSWPVWAASQKLALVWMASMRNSLRSGCFKEIQQFLHRQQHDRKHHHRSYDDDERHQVSRKMAHKAKKKALNYRIILIPTSRLDMIHVSADADSCGDAKAANPLVPS